MHSLRYCEHHETPGSLLQLCYLQVLLAVCKHAFSQHSQVIVLKWPLGAVLKHAICCCACSMRQLRMFLDEYPDIPYSTLSYTCGECNYGGKVTDAHDRHTLMTVLESYYTPHAVDQESFHLSVTGKYVIPPSTNYQVNIARSTFIPITGAFPGANGCVP